MTKTKIEWSEEVWNPVRGCTKVSPGCDNCYAERITNRFHGKGAFDKVVLHSERLEIPLKWRKPRLVFVNSMSDLFHDEIPDEFIAQVFAVMALTPQHAYQVLTKRPGRMRSLLTRSGFEDFPYQVADAALSFGFVWDARGDRRANYGSTSPVLGVDLSNRRPWPGWPLPNVWLGVSVENQKWADIRIPKFLETPAAVRFLSCEPLLGPLDLRPWVFSHNECVHCGHDNCYVGALDLRCGNTGKKIPERIDWVIAGGESGPGARPMHPEWACSLRDQCQAAGTPYFFKQWGEWRWAREVSDFAFEESPEGQRWIDYTAPAEVWLSTSAERFPSSSTDSPKGSAYMQRVGKKRAGRELDGRTWDEMPSLVGQGE